MIQDTLRKEDLLQSLLLVEAAFLPLGQTGIDFAVPRNLTLSTVSRNIFTRSGLRVRVATKSMMETWLEERATKG